MSLNFGTIYKREISIPNSLSVNEATHDSVVKMQITNLMNSINNEISRANESSNDLIKHEATINPSITRYASEYIDSMKDNVNSGRYLEESIIFIESLNKIDEDWANTFANDITSFAIPRADVKDLSRVQYRLNEENTFNITDHQRNILKESIKNNIAADRILENHAKLCKRFNIVTEIKEIRSKGLARTVESMCDIVNTYKIEAYQKLNVCIEEMFYILSKNGVKFDKQDLVKEAVENIILTNELDLHTLNGYRKALNDSYCLDEEDLGEVEYITNKDYYTNTDNIENCINKFLLSPDKNAASLISVCYNASKNNSIYDLRNNIDKILLFIRKCLMMNNIDQDAANRCIDIIKDTIINREDIDENSINIILSKIDDCLKDQRFVCRYNVKDDEDKNSTLRDYIYGSKEDLRDTNNIFYDKYNLESLNFFSKEPTLMSVNEFKIFKFNNLIKAAFNLDKYLKIKSRQAMSGPKKKLAKFVAKARNVLFGENASEEVAKEHLGSYLSENNIPDICVAIYEYDDNHVLDLREFLTEVCREFNENNATYAENDIKAYYLINPGCAEVHVRENVQLNIVEEDGIKKELSFEEAYYLNLLEDTIEIMEDTTMNHLDSIESFINEFCKKDNITEDELSLALEAMSVLQKDQENINIFKYQYMLTRTMLNESANDLLHLFDEFKNIEGFVTENDKLEAYNTLAALLEADIHKPKVGPSTAASYWDDDDEDEDDDDSESKHSANKDDKKEESGDDEDMPTDQDSKEFAKMSKKKFGVDLNGLKLAMLGMKKKLGDMGQKERELSNDLDNNARRLVKGLKDAMISDRREAIIKGSIIPSFSKCIKIAVGLAGVAKFIDPGLAIIAAIGGFAMSKHLTHKERILLLDDIEVELDVVEKEISLAESRNQINKYRALQRYKKDLQRQYQRIKYNVRVGKDILPGSTVGVKTFD